MQYLKLLIIILGPAIATILLWKLNKNERFHNIGYVKKQIIYGVVFGIVAIIGSELGIPVEGAQINARDGSVLVGGFLFGGPAGIIAGVIAGVERYLAAMWGVGTYTKVACLVATIVAGVFAALIKKTMLKNKKNFWLFSLLSTVVIEIFHMALVMLTHMDTPNTVIKIVKLCTTLQIMINLCVVMIANIVYAIIHKERVDIFGDFQSISSIIQRQMIAVCIMAFTMAIVFNANIQNNISKNTTSENIQHTLVDIRNYITDIKDNSIKYNEEKSIDLQVKEKLDNYLGHDDIVIIRKLDDKIISKSHGVTQNEAEKLIKEVTDNKSSLQSIELEDKEYYAKTQKIYDYYVTVAISYEEANLIKDIVIHNIGFGIVLIFGFLFYVTYLLIDKIIIKQIKNINDSLHKITSGDLNERVSATSSVEFISLSNDINTTVEALKNYTKEVEKRMEQDLKNAKIIQESSLPHSFPKNDKFEIYASMNAAKEVGGDFYDVYQTSNNTLNFLIADVSGKGVPAALFMMRAKSILRSLAENSLDIAEIFEMGNNKLCEGNDAQLFVTAWQGQLNLESGVIEYANAGHNPPLIKKAGGEFEYYVTRPNFVLAGIENSKYKKHTIDIEKGDIIFVYTDGVTEATNKDEELYGEDRLRDVLNKIEYDSMEELCGKVFKDVMDFTGEGVDQFDDVTMLALKYK